VDSDLDIPGKVRLPRRDSDLTRRVNRPDGSRAAERVRQILARETSPLRSSEREPLADLWLPLNIAWMMRQIAGSSLRMQVSHTGGRPGLNSNAVTRLMQKYRNEARSLAGKPE
jgi:hypothetical protein